MRRKLITLSVVIIVGGYVCSFLYVEATRTVEIATLGSRLGEIGALLVDYRSDHGFLPEQGIAAFDLPIQCLQDPMTGEPFIYHAQSNNDTLLPLVEQVTEFRTKLWPFGDIRRYAVYNDGSVRNIYTVSAGSQNQQ